jgi:hypothetical protein
MSELQLPVQLGRLSNLSTLGWTSCVCLEAVKRQKGRRKWESKKESREGVQLFAAVVAQGELPGADLGVVLRELGQGFESLWVPNQCGSIR